MITRSPGTWVGGKMILEKYHRLHREHMKPFSGSINDIYLTSRQSMESSYLCFEKWITRCSPLDCHLNKDRAETQLATERSQTTSQLFQHSKIVSPNPLKKYDTWC